MEDLLCKKCDVFVGYGAASVVKAPEDKSSEWLRDHCWVCHRSREEVERDPRGDGQEPLAPLGDMITEPSAISTARKLDPPEAEPAADVRSASTEVSTFVDRAMFDAEQLEEGALERPRVYLLSATPDPLGAVAAFSMMYEGRVIRDLSEITDDERRHYFDECFKTALQTPLEAIDLHFMIEGLTRATWDQARTQRTAVFAGESLRFAVKPDLKDSVRPGPMVRTKTQRGIHDRAIESLNAAYHSLIAAGVPQEDARGLLPMNVLTRGHWKTNLRNLQAEVGKRLCTQAQFEWRVIHADLRRAIRERASFGEVRRTPGGHWTADPTNWQWEYIAESAMFQPICFQKGACMFKASMDRGCTIRERVDAGRFDLIETAEWLADPTAAWVK